MNEFQLTGKLISGLVIGGIVILALTISAIMGIGINNRYSMLIAKAKAQQDVSKVTFDNTWKIIQGQASVADKERESFRSVFVEIMDKRVGNDGNLIMKWSQEAQVPISPDLYKSLLQSIESQRMNFLEAQKMLTSIRQEGDTLKTTFPGSFYLRNRPHIEIQLVTSTKTESAFSLGKDESYDPFEKK